MLCCKEDQCSCIGRRASEAGLYEALILPFLLDARQVVQPLPVLEQLHCWRSIDACCLCYLGVLLCVYLYQMHLYTTQIESYRAHVIHMNNILCYGLRSRTSMLPDTQSLQAIFRVRVAMYCSLRIECAQALGSCSFAPLEGTGRSAPSRGSRRPPC